MNTNWAKILLFTLLGFALGHIVTYLCMCRCGQHGGHECHAGACGQAVDGACCPAHGHGGKGHGGHGQGHEERVSEIVHGLKASGFQGDTTIQDGGAIVRIGIHGEKTEVRVEMSDSVVVEKTVEVH